MKCPAEMQKSSTLGSQGISVVVAVSTVGIGKEVDVEMCVDDMTSVRDGTTEAVRVKVACGVIVAVGETDAVEQDTNKNTKRK